MKRFWFVITLFSAALLPVGAQSPVVRPFETEAAPAVTSTTIDTLVQARLSKLGISPAPLCSDEVFVRRVYLDVIGTLPTAQQVQEFMLDRRADKRAALIDTLLKRDEFADYWTLKWCDLLRVKSEFPINLWPNAVQAYARWIHDALKQNWPYDRFARELLTSSGSNFRVGSVNFYRAIQGRNPSTIADAVALTLMGTRLAKWPEPNRQAMAAFFSRVSYKETGEWKEEIVELNPNTTSPLEAVFPDGTRTTIAPDQDPRKVFADWLITPSNPYFTRNIANRVWSWLMGRGIIQEPDDIRPDNPPSNPELLTYLEKELVNAHYDLRQLYRLILNSRTYQQSSIARGTNPQAEALFAFYPVRRLDAEVLVDALCQFGGTGEDYQSPIPEPFTFIPEAQRSITLSDGSITSPFLEMFGRPSRDTGLESERLNQPNDAQRLHLLNSTHVQKKIENSQCMRELFKTTRGKRSDLIRMIYLTLLSREPSPQEQSAAESYFMTPGLNAKQAADDLAWALINTKEFLYRH